MPTEIQNDNKVIITLLKEAKEVADKRSDKQDQSNDHIHECIHSIDDSVRGIKAYFIGIDPQNHIIHHVRMEEAADMGRDIKKAIYGSIVSIVFTGIMAFMQWSAVQAQKEMQMQITEIVRAQSQSVKK